MRHQQINQTCKPDIEQKLEALYDLLVDDLVQLKNELNELILHPERIRNSNKFASLLVALKDPAFIDPLLQTISTSKKGDPWLTDLLYACIELLDERSEDDEFRIPPDLIDNVKDWILNNKGELAWKAAGLLKFHRSGAAEKIQLKKLEERDDFFLTYAECIIGLLWYDPNKHIELVRQIAADPSRDAKLREFAESAVEKYS